MSTQTPTVKIAPFVPSRDHDDYEQVRPYFAAYSAIRAEIEAAQRYPYDASFKGRIPGLAEAASRDEDTCIYLLQQMHALDAMNASLDAFRTRGALPLAEVDLREGREVRGTLVRFGWYSGGTGLEVREDTRISLDGRGYVVFKKPRQRAGRTNRAGVEQYLFLAAA